METLNATIWSKSPSYKLGCCLSSDTQSWSCTAALVIKWKVHISSDSSKFWGKSNSHKVSAQMPTTLTTGLSSISLPTSTISWGATYDEVIWIRKKIELCLQYAGTNSQSWDMCHTSLTVDSPGKKLSKEISPSGQNFDQCTWLPLLKRHRSTLIHEHG